MYGGGRAGELKDMFNLVLYVFRKHIDGDVMQNRPAPAKDEEQKVNSLFNVYSLLRP